MIAKLTGKVIEKLPPECILDVAGVGYEVFLPMTSFYKLPELNQSASIYIHQVIREDAHTLYGFHNRLHRDLFRELLKANGVGPKLALAILSAMSAEEFISIVQSESVGLLVKVPGVGKKTAERLLLEMKDKLVKWSAQMVSSGIMLESTSEPMIQNTEPSSGQDAIEALVALGYKTNQAESAVKKVAKTGLSSEEIIRQALKSML
ncbi:Holliday junction DNA helicase RuvA [Catenovulum agarivorans DS-2]|uniref:Holliday junction branch migration complex subunit RuvA n=1 Tax=Catenovulum agarivorans DS-2 TaxID=1328313 RepID=W7R084_9ALTE|nr:Holliday junction branch migration protein RuvA [Catenovulum agarivorans]EWH11030.1 Holliday junction DNA helicase RuvA [Catenovulum agarivorans DS-2]